MGLEKIAPKAKKAPVKPKPRLQVDIDQDLLDAFKAKCKRLDISVAKAVDFLIRQEMGRVK